MDCFSCANIGSMSRPGKIQKQNLLQNQIYKKEIRHISHRSSSRPCIIFSVENLIIILSNELYKFESSASQ